MRLASFFHCEFSVIINSQLYGLKLRIPQPDRGTRCRLIVQMLPSLTIVMVYIGGISRESSFIVKIVLVDFQTEKIVL